MSVIEIKVPTIGESVTEVTVAQFLVEDGDYVEIDQSLCELESDKATFELPAEVAGTVTFLVEEGQDLNIGDPVCTIDTSATAGASASNGQAKAPETVTATVEEKAATPTVTVAKTESTSYAAGHPSVAAAKLMEENGLTAAQVNGTGVDGRILKEDVLKAIEAKKSDPKTAAPKAPIAPSVDTSAPKVSGSRDSRQEKMSRIRKTISRRLVAAKNQTAMLTTFNEVDLTEIMALRKTHKDAFKEKHGVGLGFMSFFTKACAIALQDFPAVNAYIVDDKFIEYHDFVDISIAVSTPKGLVVPVIRNAETLSLKDIGKEVKRLALKGRDGKITMDDMTGGTFTISNGGVFGSLMSTPIINPPQSAILGMHKIQERAMVIDGEVKVRPMMYLALSYDHRIVDGKEAVTFLVRIKDLLEEPVKLFLDL